MKEEYFTLETIDDEARQFLTFVEHLRSHRELDIDHQHIALLVIDMQRYFLEPLSDAFIPSASAIIPRIAHLQSICLDQGITVFHISHLNSPENARRMSQWWPELIDRSHLCSKITCDLMDDRVLAIEKNQYDAFIDTSLQQQLEEREITQLIITGVLTHLSCETTARTAFMKGFEVFFTIDGTATFNRAFHQAALLNLSHGFAIPALVNELAGRLIF